MKRILVTGGAGFIGSNFVKHIIRECAGCQVIVLDKLTYAGNLENLREIGNNRNYRFVRGDICDRKIVDKLAEDIDCIINFAAETHVDKSIMGADDFLQTDIWGTYTLLEAVRKHRIERFVQISCYDKKTRTLTTEGLKTYKELKKGDQVFSLNPVTQEIEIKPIEKVIIQSYKGNMVHFANQRIDLFVTPNHNMFILNTKKKLVIEPAEKASQRSIFYTPEGRWRGKEEEYSNITGYDRVKTKDLMYILGIFIGDGFTAYQEKERETKTGLARKQCLKEARDRNNGRFKKIEKQGYRKTKMHSYRVFLDIPESDKCRKKVEETLLSLGIKYHCYKGRAGTHLYFTSKPFMELFNQCGEGAYNKHIPRWVLDYSPKYLQYLLQGLMDSDGCNNKIYHTVSKKLVSDICELCIKLNLKPSIHREHSKSFIGGRKIEGDIYYIFVANTIKSISRQRNKIVSYDGDIWCLKVKDNKNFIVERNGRLDFCGNTDEVYGDIKTNSSKETDPLKPSNPYAASKAAADLLVHSYYITYKLPVITIRSSNNFGPFQYPEKVIPLFITNAVGNKNLPLYGDGLNIREWLYVKDNCRAINLVLQKGEEGQIYNVGGGNEKTNLEITHLILGYLKKRESLIQYVKDREGHDRRYSLDSSNIEALGWRPQYKFEEALKETVKWYVENKEWWQKIKERKGYKEFSRKWYGGEK